ncbi:toll/interleukin-1 receptor domain-containing protein [Halomicronema sp. CCY15110]|uniref:toll/interleukin-1 receptor domain-containing protein n=1 Tax=Halomicronema sp. CCY15110 TaxID=2767773 RepID=UPI00194F2708|nr:toll/interleukin-1 receptor domain-containing protein [Halomicronema sp. CCY15110]
MADQQFDVFLCHNSEDKPAVIEIAQQLQQNNLKPWLDVWELQPGAIWQFALEQQIESIGAAAVFVGQQGLGPWQSEEIYAFLQEFIQRGCPVIPVMLPNVPKQPRLPIFLKNRHWVDFRLQDPDPLVQLVWGVTGIKPGNEKLKTAQTISPTVETDSQATALLVPNVPRKELHECDRSRILYLKNIKDPAGGWSYTLDHIRRMGGSIESGVFEMYWLLTSKGAKSAKQGDLMILNQHARVTHIVEMLDDDVRRNKNGYFRWVRIVWLAKASDWHQLPHQEEILGFSPPRFGGGTAYSFSSPNFRKFRQAWEHLSEFQLHVVNRLQELNEPTSA